MSQEGSYLLGNTWKTKLHTFKVKFFALFYLPVMDLIACCAEHLRSLMHNISIFREDASKAEIRKP